MPTLHPVPGRATAVVISIAFAGLGLVACGGSAASPPARAGDQRSAAITAPSPPTTSSTTASSTASSTSPTTASSPPEAQGAAQAATTDAISIVNFAFDPAVITVKVGTTVTWTNKDDVPHTVFSSTAGMQSAALTGGQATYSFTFTKPGTYQYNCAIHPFMKGTVTVAA